MPSITRLNRIPDKTIQRVLSESQRALATHMLDPQIIEAPDKIAKFRGFKDHKTYAFYYWTRLKGLASANALVDKMELFAESPLNSTKFFTEFLGIDTVMRLLFSDSSKRKAISVLQIASNYGPLLHYLKEVRGITEVVGVDVDLAAILYAQDIGVKVVLESADQINGRLGPRNVIASVNFLDENYLMQVTGNPVSFISTVLQKAYSLLKGGGVFISSRESIAELVRSGELNLPFSETYTFPAGINASLDEVVVLQKR